MKEDYNKIQEQLKLRTPSKLQINSLENMAPTALNNLFILSESDLGVVRNGGRRGAAYGPSAIISTLKKMTKHNNKKHAYSSIRNLFASTSFEFQQKEDIESIKGLISNNPNSSIWHLGGGHDHIYPLLKAINLNFQKILVINIDAHLDTRIDAFPHSGTPFRQFTNEVSGDFKLIQLGIHDFANEKSNYEDIPNANMDIFSVQQIKAETANYSATKTFMDRVTKEFEDYNIILSLDCDAISSDSMEAVSAVNHNGLALDFVRDLFSWYYSLPQKQKTCGIYEYNPIFDNLSNKGARVIASLIQPFL